jgi:hypothetical protein
MPLPKMLKNPGLPHTGVISMQQNCAMRRATFFWYPSLATFLVSRVQF